MLPSYDPHDTEAGLKLLEDLTMNVRLIQDQLLMEILTRNAGTEYLRRFLDGRVDKELFKRRVPVVKYEDIKPYIERITNGEPSDIISSQPITELLTRYKCFWLLFPFPSSPFSSFAVVISFYSFVTQRCRD